MIDFVGRLFQLSPYDAARKLMADFHLSPDKPPSAAALHAKRIRTEAPDERFAEACHKLDEVEHYLDILCAGDSYERAEVVSYLLADGRLDKLKETINGRDAA